MHFPLPKHSCWCHCVPWDLHRRNPASFPYCLWGLIFFCWHLLVYNPSLLISIDTFRLKYSPQLFPENHFTKAVVFSRCFMKLSTDRWGFVLCICVSKKHFLWLHTVSVKRHFLFGLRGVNNCGKFIEEGKRWDLKIDYFCLFDLLRESLQIGVVLSQLCRPELPYTLPCQPFLSISIIFLYPRHYLLSFFCL